MDFFEVGRKMSMGRVLNENFGVSECFHRKFVKNNTSRAGTSKIDVFGAFYIFEISAKWEKNWFLSCHLKKMEQMGVIFEGAVQNFFYKSLLIYRVSSKKIHGGWLRIQEVTWLCLSVFILSEQAR